MRRRGSGHQFLLWSSRVERRSAVVHFTANFRESCSHRRWPDRHGTHAAPHLPPPHPLASYSATDVKIPRAPFNRNRAPSTMSHAAARGGALNVDRGWRPTATFPPRHCPRCSPSVGPPASAGSNIGRQYLAPSVDRYEIVMRQRTERTERSSI